MATTPISTLPGGFDWPFGGDSEAGRFNYHVYNPTEFLAPVQVEGHSFEIGMPLVRLDGRICSGVRVDGKFIHPFYRSTGRCTPGKSPEGTWWPFAGLTGAGWLGKFFWDPGLGEWLNHHKHEDRLPPPYREFCKLIEGIVMKEEG